MVFLAHDFGVKVHSKAFGKFEHCSSAFAHLDDFIDFAGVEVHGHVDCAGLDRDFLGIFVGL